MSDILGRPGPRWFTIAAHRPFLDDLATGVLAATAASGSRGLAAATLLAPTRRAARLLADSFLKVGAAAAVILPRILVLGDLDEGEPPFEAGALALDLPPAISPWRRRFELAGLVADHQQRLNQSDDAVSALRLADALAAFLDGCHIEEADPIADIETLVEGELARHWRVSADFLNLVLRAWPRRLAELGVMDVAERRVALLRGLADRWVRAPPTGLVFAAGSTGSAPASADLLAAIAHAPLGCVVLPGLDTELAEAAWREIGEQHPQFAMSRLLARAGVTRADVADWPSARPARAASRWRRRLISEALRPPDRTADWLMSIRDLRAESGSAAVDPIAEGLKGLSLVTARTEEEAATAAALLLREVLETPGKTAALISPDPGLARRVSARLRRWGVTADSSAGQPLAAAPAAVLAALVARWTADPADPVTLLAILKHPLTRLRRPETDLEPLRTLIEARALRGARPAGFDGVRERLQRKPDADGRAAVDLVTSLESALDLASAPFKSEAAAPVEAVSRALVSSIEAVCERPGGAALEPWSGLVGETLAAVLQALITESGALPKVTRAGFSELLGDLMARELVRFGGASHPRLQILGVLEARLVRADRLILAGLEEGVWPSGASIDPFLSRPMRAALGLSSPERRIGLSAHDFAQAACAPEVILLHAERRGGAPAVASRWLWRLRTLVGGAELAIDDRSEVLAWSRSLDAPLNDPPESLKTARRPRPTPPVAARPRTLGVTGVEQWIRDPYGLYARRILNLRPLERPDEPVEARARGIAVHAAFERFAKVHPGELPPDPHGVFAALLIDALREKGMPETRMAREQALAHRVAPWAMDFERRRRPGAALSVEVDGLLNLDVPGGRFTLTARADRIEARGATADLLDFKTGLPPSVKMVRAGFSPQLTLTGAILAAGGFAELGALDPGELVYVRVSGGRIPGKEDQPAAGQVSLLVEQALAGLRRRVISFDQAATSYPSWAAPQYMGRQGGDYDHLARLWEWHVVGEADGDAT